MSDLLQQLPSKEQIAGILALNSVFGSDTQKCPKNERFQYVRTLLIQNKYHTCLRKDQGLMRRYLRTITEYSHSQLSRIIKLYRDGKTARKPSPRHRFSTKFTAADKMLLAQMDDLHGHLNGNAMRKIFQQMAPHDKRFTKLSSISTSHLYNLRKTSQYRDQSGLIIDKTKPVQRKYGERQKPRPNGAPGFLRVDTVHQGDLEGKKGIYHINLVDEVTQWEVVLACEGISEKFLQPVLQEALRLFPFTIHNFHSDNGSEYINETVSKLLNAHTITQTKSRPRKSNDNGLVESKNASVIRKQMGYFHIPGTWAPRVNAFYRTHLIPYINFHRPCAFPTIEHLKNGKKKIRYKASDYKTPYEKFLSLEHASTYLRPDITLKILKQEATQATTNDMAYALQKAKTKLLELIINFSETLPQFN